MSNEIITKVSGEKLNDTPIGLGEVNPATGLNFGKREINVDKLDKALYPGERMGKTYINEVVPKSIYHVLGDNYHPEFDPEYNAILLSREQTPGGKAVNAITQALGAQIGAASMEGISYLLDLPMAVDLLEGTEQEFGNFLTDLSKTAQQGFQERYPVYTDPTRPKFDPVSWGWWMSNAPSAVSTVSLLLPAIGGMKALSTIGKFAGIAEELGTLGKYSKFFSTSFGEAVLSRQAESLMEVNSNYQQNLETTKNQLYQKYASQIDNEIKGLPLTTPVDPELGVKPGQYTEGMRDHDIRKIQAKWDSKITEEAKKKVAVGAAAQYAENWVMLLQDIPEYMLLNRFIKPGVKSIAKTAEENTAKVAERVGMNMPKFYTSMVAKQLGNMAGEGFEEGYQFIVSQQVSKMIQHLDDPDTDDSMVKTVKDNFGNGDLWTNVFWGAIGAGVMQAAGAGLNAKAFAKSTEVRLQNINTWSTLTDKLYSDYVAAEEMGDKSLMDAAKQNFVAAVGLKAKELGNKDHLLNMIDALSSGDGNVLQNYEMSSDTRSFIKGHSEIAQELKDSIESISKKYDDAVKEVEGRGVTGKNVYSIARSIAHSNHMLEYLNNKVNEAQQKVNGVEIAGYNKPDVEGNTLSDSGKQVFSARHEKTITNKKISQKKKRLGAKNITKNETDQLNRLIGRLEDKVKNIDKTVKQIRKDYSPTDEQRAIDNKLLGSESGKKPGTISQSEVETYLTNLDELESYKLASEEFKDSLAEAREYADKLGERDKGKPADEKPADIKPAEDDDSNIYPGSLVSYIDPDTRESRIGIVDNIDYAIKDSEGNEQRPVGESADNIVTVTSIDKADKGKQIHLSGLSVNPVSTEIQEALSNALAEDDLDDWDDIIESLNPDAINKRDEYRRQTNRPVDMGKERGLMEFVSYTDYGDISKEDRKARRLPKLNVRNDKFNKFISNPENQKYLSNAITEYEIDKENEKFKQDIDEIRKQKGLHKTLNATELKHLDALMAGKKLHESELKTLLSNAFVLSNIPIKLKVTINGQSFEDGLFLHTLDKTKGSLSNPELYTSYSTLRRSIITHLSKNESIYTVGMDTNRGNPTNIDKTNNRKTRQANVATVFGIDPKNTKLYINKSSTKLSKQVSKDADKPGKGSYNRPILMESADTECSVPFDMRSPGSVFIKVENTVNGQPFAVKLNKSFVSPDHAALIFHAFSTLAKTEVADEKGTIRPIFGYDTKTRKVKIVDKGNIGRYNTMLGTDENNSPAWNISAGELLDLLVVHGEELTNPDHSRYSAVNEYKRMTNIQRMALKSKRLFLQRGYDSKGNINAVYLCYGVTPQSYEIDTSTPGVKKSIDYNRINLTANIQAATGKEADLYADNRKDFIEWITGTGVYSDSSKNVNKAGMGGKTYAVHIENKRIHQKLNGSIFNGRKFRIGKKGLLVQPADLLGKRYEYKLESEIVHEQGDSYVEFLIKNNIVTTDIESKDGLMFDTPWVGMGFDRTKKDFNIQVGQPDYKSTKIEGEVVSEKVEQKPEVKLESKKKSKVTKKTRNKVDDILNKNKVNLRERKQSIRQPYERQELEKELSWVRKKLNIKKEEVEIEKRLANMMLHGRKAWGIYSNEAIKLYEFAEQGTIYHEGFHRVSLGYFSKDEREALYRSARLLYKMPKEEFTDNQVEEKLAEEFRLFVLTKEQEPQPSLIKRVFRNIVDFIKAVFIGVGGKRLTHGDINRLFNQIYSGRYRYSRVRKENLGITPRLREMMGKQFNTIATYEDMTDVTKFLANELLAVNRINDLTKVRKIKWQSLIQSLNETISDMQNIIDDPEESDTEINRAIKVRDLLNDILGEKVIVKDTKGNEKHIYPKFVVFKNYVNKFLRGVGIAHYERNIEDDDFYGSDGYIENLDSEETSMRTGSYDDIDYYKPLKDNALADVKFLVSTLHDPTRLSESTGMIGFANGNKVWSKLLGTVIKYNDVSDMINEIKRVGEIEDYYPFIELAERLDKSTPKFKTRFLTTFEAWKHNFVNASFIDQRYDETRIGVNITFDDAGQSELKWSVVGRWNEFLHYDRDIVTIESETKDGTVYRTKSINKEFFKELALEYRDKVENHYNNISTEGHDEISEEALDDLLSTISKILGKLHIDVSNSVLRRYIHDIDPSVVLQDNIRVAISNILDMISIETLFDEEEGFRSIKSNRHVMALGNAYATVNTHEEAQMVLAPDGGSFYKYAKLNHATDSVRKIKRGSKWAEDKLQGVWNKHSIILNSFVPQDDSEEAATLAESNRNKFNLVTLDSLRSSRGSDRGRNYLKINTVEDYLLKANAILNGQYLPFPIIANRQTYHLMEGVKTIGIYEGDITSNVIKSSTPEGEVQFTDEVLDIFYGYYLDEKARVRLAKLQRKEYEQERDRLEKEKNKPNADVKQIEKDIRALKNTLIKNYHYHGDYNLKLGNAYNYIHFKGFTSDMKPEEVRTKINKILNDRLNDEIVFTANKEIISVNIDKTSKEKLLYSRLLNNLLVSSHKDFERHQNFPVLSILSKVMINNMISVIESEKLFLGDPALFKRNKKMTKETKELDVYDDLYKRWFGVGSTGTKLRANYPGRSNSYNASTFSTQKFSSTWKDELIDSHTKFYTNMLANRLNEAERNNVDIAAGIIEEARKLATDRLKKFDEVDATDGSAFISPEMYREILDRLGLWDWTGSMEKAFQLLQSNQKLSAEDIIEASNIVFSPLKTMYIGNHMFNNVDMLIYDKMAMFTLFRQHVNGTHLEEVLDRMESKGKYKWLPKVDVFNFDSAVKVGGMHGINMFKNPKTRDKVEDLSEAFIFEQSFENLIHQQVIEPHDARGQNFGTAGIKIGSSDIHQNEKYGKFATGRELLQSLTEARSSISNFGIHKINAKFGIANGKISDKVFIHMLQMDAESANKSEDFQQALRTDEKGEKYLELDAFPNRKWIYSRVKSIVDEQTIQLTTPGNQLVQMTDYGMGNSRFFGRDLKITRLNNEGTKVLAMECRVSKRLFKPFFPAGHNITVDDINKLLKDETTIFGYRVPTQGQGSIFKLEIVDFLPEQTGDIIQLPLEFTAITGSDFDIDKLFVAMYSYEHEYKGSNFIGLKKIQFKDNDNSTVEERYTDKIIELFGIYRRNSKLFEHSMVSRYFDDYVKNGARLSEMERKIKELNDEYDDEIELLENNREVLLDALENLKGKSDEELENIREDLSMVSNRLEELHDRILNTPAELRTLQTIIPEDLNIIKNILINNNILPSLETFATLPLSEQNTNSANSNQLLDCIFTVLSSPLHFVNMTTPLGSNTDKIEDKSDYYGNTYAKAQTRNVPALFTTTPSFQSNTKEKFSSATFGIPSYALNNNHHSLTQAANVTMVSDIKFGFNKDNRVRLNRILSEDMVPVTGWLSALIDVHVDGVNKPIASNLNINEATHNVIAFMIRAGVGEPTFDFIAQPAIKEYAAKYFKAPPKGNKRYTTIFSTDSDNPLQDTIDFYKELALNNKYFTEEELNNFKDRMLVSLQDILYKQDKSTGRLIPNTEKLQADAPGLNDPSKRSREWYHRQISILYHFADIKPDADLLNKFVLASRVDTKKYGANPVEILYFIKSMENVIASEKFINIEKILNTDPDYVYKIGDTFLPTLIHNSMFKITDILKFESIYSSPGFQRMLSEIISVSSKTDYSRMGVINTLTEELMTYLFGKFFADEVGIDSEKLHSIIFGTHEGNFFERIVKAKQTLPDNAFLDSVVVDMSNRIITDRKGEPVNFTYLRTRFRSLSDETENNEITNGFKELLYSKDKELREIAQFLYVYSFYTSGFRNKRNSYASWLPLEMNREFNIEGTDKTVSLNNHVKNLLSLLNTPNAYKDMIQEAKREVILNVADNSEIVPVHSSLNVVWNRETKDGETICIRMDYTKDKSIWMGYNDNGDHVFQPFIRLNNDNTIYEYVGYDRTSNDPFYVPVSTRGFGNKGIMVHEYGIKNKANLDSSIFAMNNPLSFLSNPEELINRALKGLKPTQAKAFKRVMFDDQIVKTLANYETEFGENPDAAGEMRDAEKKLKIEQAEKNKELSRYSTGEEAKDKNPKVSIDNKTTPYNPIVIDIDGSAHETKAPYTFGGAAISTYAGKSYNMVFTDKDVRDWFKKVGVEISPNAKNELAELFSLFVVVNTFSNTSEHLHLKQDYNGCMMYFRDIHENYAVNPEEAFSTSPNKEWNSNNKDRPDIAKLVGVIKDRITKIYNNGGSVKMEYVKTKTTDNAKLVDKIAKGEHEDSKGTKNTFRSEQWGKPAPDAGELSYNSPYRTLAKIISGGQTGVDEAGLEVAYENNLLYGGTAAHGFMQSVGTDIFGKSITRQNLLLKTKYGLKEGEKKKVVNLKGSYDDIYTHRTEQNVKNSNGTVWFGNDSPGKKATFRYIEKYKRPSITNPTPEELASWIERNGIRILNVAGNREHTNIGIKNRTKETLKETLELLKKPVSENKPTNLSSKDMQEGEEQTNKCK